MAIGISPNRMPADSLGILLKPVKLHGNTDNSLLVSSMNRLNASPSNVGPYTAWMVTYRKWTIQLSNVAERCSAFYLLNKYYKYTLISASDLDSAKNPLMWSAMTKSSMSSLQEVGGPADRQFFVGDFQVLEMVFHKTARMILFWPCITKKTKW